MTLTKTDTINLVFAFFTAFLDLLNYSLISPMLPSIVKELRATAMESGILYSGYALFQLFSVWIMGYYSDKYGRKVFLLLSLVGSCFGSILQAISSSIWQLIIFRAITGLFAGSIIVVQAMVADMVPNEDRNKYYARLGAVCNGAYILGPAIGGILSSISNRFPLYIAGVVAGISLVVSSIALKETNPKIKKTFELRDKIKKASKEERVILQIELDDNKNNNKKKEKKNKMKPNFNLTMVMCFIIEFCNMWASSAFTAKYGFYLDNKFHEAEKTFSIIASVTSLYSCLQQAFIYPWLTGRHNISLYTLSIVGMSLQVIAYIVMGSAPKWFSIAFCGVLWAGFGLSQPTPMSVLSMNNADEVQGTVLSWNNISNQISQITGPLILSPIYAANIDATYFMSAGVGGVGLIAAIVLSRLSVRVLVIETMRDVELADKSIDIMNESSPVKEGEMKIE